jgi:hypothetical protein
MSMQYGYDEIRKDLGHFLGFGRTYGDWSTDQAADVDDMIQEGLQMAYTPPPLETGYVHEWSFLKPTGTIPCVSGTAEYDLPTDFEEFEGPYIHWASTETSRYAPIEIVPTSYWIEMQSLFSANTHPQYASLFPKDADGSAVQAWQVKFHPTPNSDYDLVYQYKAFQEMLSVGNPYPLGGPTFSHTVLLACRAAAEYKDRNEEGPAFKKFMVSIMREIGRDMKRPGRILGYNGNGRHESVYPNRAHARRLLLIHDGGITYNGSSYDS